MPRLKHRRGNHDDFSSHHRSRPFSAKVDSGLALDTQSLNWFAAARLRFIIIRTLIDDGRVAVSDVGDVGCLVDDSHVAFARHHGGFDSLRAKFVHWNKRILVGADVVVIVGPVMNAGAPIEARFRRQRRPTDVIVALTPGNPRRRPFVAGHPDPANVAQAGPASVMICGPTKRLVRNPGPTGIGVNPPAVGVGTPVSRRLRFARLPNVTVIAGLAPRAVTIELRVESVVRGCRTALVDARSTLFRPRRMRFSLRSLRGRGRAFLLRDLFFARTQLRLALRELFLFLYLVFGIEALLHLTVDLGFTFRFSLFFLTRTKDRQSDHN